MTDIKTPASLICRRFVSDHCNEIILHKDEFTIGRSGRSSLIIKDSSISSIHAVLYFKDGQWSISNRSSSGICINNVRFKKIFERHTLKNKDEIQFGDSDMFVFTFYEHLQESDEPSAKKFKSAVSDNSTSNEGTSMTQPIEDQEMECLSEEESLEGEDEFDNSDQFSDQESSCDEEEHHVIGLNDLDVEEDKKIREEEEYVSKLRQELTESRKTVANLVMENQKLADEKELKFKEFEQRLENQQKNYDDKAVQMEAGMLKQMTVLEQMHENQMRGLHKMLEDEDKKIIVERVKLEAQFEEEKLKDRQNHKEMNFKMKEDLNEKLKAEVQQKEDIILQLSSKVKNLQEKKIKTEEQFQGILLKKEGVSLLQLHKLQEDVIKVKTDLCETNAKERMLELELAEVKKEKASLLQASLQNRRDILNSICKIMETEFLCSICSEVYIVPSTVNCMHTFCMYCIKKWKETNNCCPMCRVVIKEENCFIELDNFIDKVFENLPEDIRNRRSEEVKDQLGKKMSLN